MRIGIFSGTFDPIHEGHILFGQVAAEQFGLDKVLITPEPEPRYKKDVSLSEHRLNMIALAASGHPTLEPNFIEGASTHTVANVLVDVHNKFPEDEYFVLLGSDVFEHIGNWGSHELDDGKVGDIASSVGFIVGIQAMKELSRLREIAESFGLSSRFLEMPLATISSRNIREKIRTGETQVSGLNDAVRQYIDEKNLYN